MGAITRNGNNQSYVQKRKIGKLATLNNVNIVNKDVLKIIFKQLNVDDLLRVKNVCWRFHDIALSCVTYLPSRPGIFMGFFMTLKR